MPETRSTSESMAILAQNLADMSLAIVAQNLAEMSQKMNQLVQAQSDYRATFTGLFEQLRGEMQELKLSQATADCQNDAEEKSSSEHHEIVSSSTEPKLISEDEMKNASIVDGDVVEEEINFSHLINDSSSESEVVEWKETLGFAKSICVSNCNLSICSHGVCQNASMDYSSYFMMRTDSDSYILVPEMKADDLSVLLRNMNDLNEVESSLVCRLQLRTWIKGVQRCRYVKFVDGNYVYDKGRSDMYDNEWYGVVVKENMKVKRGAVTYNSLLAALSKYELLSYSLPNRRPSLPSENVFKIEGYMKERKMSDIFSCLKDELYPEDVRKSKPKLHLLVALISLCAAEGSLSNQVLVRCDMVMPISELVDADTENVISKAISEPFHINGSIVDVSHELKLCSSIFSPGSKSVAMDTSDFCIKGVQQYAPEILIHTLLPPAKPPDGFFPDSELLSNNFLAAGSTTVTPTHFVVPNIDGRDGDHSVMYVAYQPPHAVVTNDLKYDYKSMQGYVRSSANEIIGRVTKGTCASTKNILKLYSWSGVLAFVSQIYKAVLDKESDHEIWTSDQIESNIVRWPFPEYVDKMIDAIDDVQLKDDSNGGSVICIDRTASWRLSILVPDELESESFKVGHKCHYTYYFSRLKLDITVMGSTQDVYMKFIDNHKARRCSIFWWNLNSVNELHLRDRVTWEFWMILSISDGVQMRSCAERSLRISINMSHFLKMLASWTCKILMWEPLVRETEKITAKGIKKTIKALVADLKFIFTEVKETQWEIGALGKSQMHWAVTMVVGMDMRNPWIMYKQEDLFGGGMVFTHDKSLRLPVESSFGIFDIHKKMNIIKLYGRRLFVMDNCERLTPKYFGFIKGVVDSEELLLKLFREILQQNKILEMIRSINEHAVVFMAYEFEKKSNGAILVFDPGGACGYTASLKKRCILINGEWKEDVIVSGKDNISDHSMHDAWRFNDPIECLEVIELSLSLVNKFLKFSLPRPPEFANLEDKVILKEEGMLHIQINISLGT